MELKEKYQIYKDHIDGLDKIEGLTKDDQNLLDDLTTGVADKDTFRTVQLTTVFEQLSLIDRLIEAGLLHQDK